MKEGIRRTWLMHRLKNSRISQTDFERFEAWYDRDGPKSTGPNISSDITTGEVNQREFLQLVPEFFAQAVRNFKVGANNEDDEQKPAISIQDDDPEDDEFNDHIYHLKDGRAPFLTNTRLYGLGSTHMLEGGVVYIAVGSEVPWLLGHLQNDEYEFLGECYVHGVMDGEWMDLLESSDIRLEYIILG